jgi:hypothetical protein
LLNSGRTRQIYYFRNPQGLEVDFLFPSGNRKLFLLEAKASRIAMPGMAEPLQRLSEVISNYDIPSFLIYRPPKEESPISALRLGTKALSMEKFLSILKERG